MDYRRRMQPFNKYYRMSYEESNISEIWVLWGIIAHYKKKKKNYKKNMNV